MGAYSKAPPSYKKSFKFEPPSNLEVRVSNYNKRVMIHLNKHGGKYYVPLQLHELYDLNGVMLKIFDSVEKCKEFVIALHGEVDEAASEDFTLVLKSKRSLMAAAAASSSSTTTKKRRKKCSAPIPKKIKKKVVKSPWMNEEEEYEREEEEEEEEEEGEEEEEEEDTDDEDGRTTTDDELEDNRSMLKEKKTKKLQKSPAENWNGGKEKTAEELKIKPSSSSSSNKTLPFPPLKKQKK